MAGLIARRRRGRTPPDDPGILSLFVDGVCYTNSAAKFWPSLIDEVRYGFPACALVDLSTLTGCALERRHLFPVLALQEGLNQTPRMNLREMLADTLKEMELLGPPAAVVVRLFSEQGNEILSCDLPLDCVDADTFPYLLVWPLQWSRIPDFFWNNASVKGNFRAEDRSRHLEYDVGFNLDNQHLSEGLYRRTMSVIFSVSSGRQRRPPGEEP
jgi:hypothetical protein